MAKDPAFLFYPGDWLGGTMGMTIEQKGAYMELLVFQFNNGPFSQAQAKQVLSICFASVWQVVSKKFVMDPVTSLYSNKRLNDEIEKRRKFSESRRNNAKGHTETKSTSKAYAKHMENENKDKDIVTVLASNVFSFLQRKGSNTSEVSYMVLQWQKEGVTDIMEQLKAMKEYYKREGLTFPTKIDTIRQSLPSADWIEKIKESNPVQYGKPADPDTIGTSAPGSLE